MDSEEMYFEAKDALGSAIRRMKRYGSESGLSDEQIEEDIDEILKED